MLNFETDLDRQLQQQQGAVVDAVKVTEKVTFRRPEQRATYAGKPPEAWTWEDLQAYVVRQIESRFGPFPRNHMKEVGIFKGFMKRHGPDAGRIAKYVFEVHQGRWGQSPVTVTRFCAGSDPHFAKPILEWLNQE